MMHSSIPIAVAIFSCLTTARMAGAAPSTVHTASVEIDGCLPMANSQVLAATAGGLVLVGKGNKELARFTALDGLPGTRVHALAKAKRGTWVGTEGGAVLVSFKNNRLQILESFSSKAVRGLHVDGQTLYAGTWGQGLLRYRNGQLQSVGPKTRKRRARVTSVTKHKGELWWTTAGAGLWHQGKSGIRRSNVVAKDAVLWAVQSDSQTLWISGEGGVSTLNGKRAGAVRAARSTATIDGERYAASFGGGLQALGGDVPVRPRPAARFARSIGSGHSITCMGTQSDLWVLRDASWEQAQLRSGLQSNDVAAFAVGKGQSFVGTFDQGVAVIEGKKITHLDLEIDPHVNALAIDAKSGGLWIGTSSGLVLKDRTGLHRYNKDSGLPARHVMSLFALPKGGVLVGTAAGAAWVRDHSVEVVGGKRAIATGNVWAVAQGPANTCWLGTTRGLFRIREGVVTRFRVASGHLPDDWVMALAVAEDGIFVGTYKSGVVRLSIAGTQVKATPLGPGWINPAGLHWDGSTLWAATMGGPRKSDGLSPTWSLEPNGPGEDTTAFVPTSDGDWVATRRGLVHRRR